MKLFSDPRKAQDHAAEGHQALHVYRALPMKVPAVIKRYKEWAHLFDQERGQHIDLCGSPLERARLIVI